MKLYTYDPAPNPRRLNLFLAHKGIRIPTEQVDLGTGVQFSAEFQAISPRCIVPVLQLDDGTVLADGIAICSYLESLYPDKPLLGHGPLERAQILSWDAYVFNDGFLAVAEALRNRSSAFKDRAVAGPEPIAQIAELEARGRQRLQIFWRRLEQHLENRQFIVGDAMTFADIDAFVVVGFAAWIKERLPESRPRVQEWVRRVEGVLGVPVIAPPPPRAQAARARG